MSGERKHHPFSPSKLQALEACPGYSSKSNSDNAASLAGTLQHSAVEEGISLDDPSLSDEHAEAVLACKNYRQTILDRYPGGTTVQEVYLPVDDVKFFVPGDPTEWVGTTAGYLDFAVISADGTQAEICDWKFGLWSVEPAENNLQGIAYLLGLVKRYPNLRTVAVHFVMPHRNEIDFHTFTSDQFPALYLRVQVVVARALAELRKSGTQQRECRVGNCLFCGNLGTCPAAAGFVLKVGKKYSPAEVPDNVTPSLLSSAAASSQMMAIAHLMETWAKAVRSQITARAIEDDDWLPEEYKLMSRAENSVKDWFAVVQAARKAGVSKAAIREALTIRMTPINEAISANNPRGQKKAAMKDFTDGLLQAGILEKDEPVYFLQRLKS